MAHSEELYPILVADLLDVESSEVLRACAHRGEVAVVPLMNPPVDRRKHILEVYVPGSSEPIRMMAVPAGSPSRAGFPLRLEPCAGDDWVDIDLPAPPNKVDTVVRSRISSSPMLTERHTRDLDPAAMTPDVAPQPDQYIGRLLANGKYRLDARVGSGGMGSVYRAHHRDLDLTVAVKVLHATYQANAAFSQRFQAEALTMSRIDHPSVARVIDFGQETDGLLYLVMEYLDGIDLQAVLDREGRLPLERLVRFMMQVCAALGHVHRHGILHRDVKPHNIIIVAGHDDEEDLPTEVAKVCDFGLALAFGAEGKVVAGTPHYMSPEQCMGAELDPRSDVYSCGVILYELATGVLPFDGDPAEILARQVREQPKHPSTVLPDLDPLFGAIIMKALSKDAGQRQQTMRQLRSELKELLAPVLLEAGDAPVSNDVQAEPEPAEDALPFEGFERIRSIRSSTETAVTAPTPEPAAAAASGGRMSRTRSGEVWLDESGNSTSSFLMTLAQSVEQQPSYHASVELMEAFSNDPQPWLMQMAGTHDLEQFTLMSETLQKVVRKLLASADAATLSPVITTMRGVLQEGPIEANPRAQAAAFVLRILRDPPRLQELADAALGGAADPSEPLRHVFMETKNAGAQALVEARQDRHALPSARGRFVSMMREIPGSLHVIRAALAESLARGERDGALVEDLLRAVPAVGDEATGSVVAEFLHGSTAETTAHALIALGNLWGPRAAPMMLGALSSTDENVRLAAIESLRAMGGIDALVVRHAEPILVGTQPGSDELRVALAASLCEAVPHARAAAAALLVNAFSKAAARGAAQGSTALVVGLARALLAAGGVANPVALIQEQLPSLNEISRRQLTALLQTSRPPSR